MELASLVAIYGAVVSTSVAVVQYIMYVEGRRYVYIGAHRALGTDIEFMTFKIANRSSDPVELQEVMIGNFGLGGAAGFHELHGQGFSIFKDESGDEEPEEEKSLRLPFRLGAGESVCVFFSSKDANALSGPALPDWIGSIKSNLFSIEATHSRRDQPVRVYFEMDRHYLSKSFSNWMDLVPRFRHWRFRPINRAYR